MHAVKIAITANIIVCALKFIVGIIGGSASMLAEAIHSAADTANQALLLVGLKRSQIGPSEEYPFGHGQERFVWGLISACGIFFVGAGVTIYHGVMSLLHYHEPEINQWTFLVLGISFLAEGFSFAIALKQRKSGDTANLAVLLEDGAALFSLILAAIAIVLTKFTGKTYWDALGSIIVGIILAVIAIILIKENLEYLIEKSSPEELQEEVLKQLKAFPLVKDIKDIRMIVISPEAHYARAEVELNGHLLSKEIEKTLAQEFQKVQKTGDLPHLCTLFAHAVTRTVGRKIDEMEEALKKKLHFLKYVDIKPS